jgi:tetratricopeptide (TPR) repeat protein
MHAATAFRCPNCGAELLADEGRLEDAVAMCRQAAALDPGCPEPEYLMAFLLRGHGRHAEALYHAERALERDPRFVFADMEAAECLCGMGRGGGGGAAVERDPARHRGERAPPASFGGGGDLPGDAAPIRALPTAAMNPVAGGPSR